MNINFNSNEDHNKLLVSDLHKRFTQVKQGGGQIRIDKLHAEGKMTARERIDYLLDPKAKSIEIAAFAGDGMYEEHGGCPSGGVVVKMGYISGKQCIVVANDASVKAGAWFPITGKKNLRAQEIAMENRIPIIYLVDSAGVYLPLQDEIFPDKEHFGRIFRNNAHMSSLGITQIAAVMGSCVAGGDRGRCGQNSHMRVCNKSCSLRFCCGQTSTSVPGARVCGDSQGLDLVSGAARW